MLTLEHYILGFFFVSLALFVSVFDLDFILDYLNGSRADQYVKRSFAKWKILKSSFYSLIIFVQLANEKVFFPLPKKDTYFLEKSDNIDLYTLILLFESLFVLLLFLLSISLLKKSQRKIDKGEIQNITFPIDRKRAALGKTRIKNDK